MSNFLDFIESEPNTIENIQIIEVIEPSEIVEPIEIIIKKPKEKFSFTRNEDNKYKIKTIQHPLSNNFTEFFLKKGDRVRIVRTERKYKVDDFGQIVILEKGMRLCDMYCGYIGEIRQFFKGNNRAIITLYAPNNLPHLDFPIDCIEKLEN